MTRTIPSTRKVAVHHLHQRAINEGNLTRSIELHDLADVLDGKARYMDDPEVVPTPLDQIQTAPARNTDPSTSKLSAIRNFTTGRGKLLKAFGSSQFPMSAERACRMAGINGTASPWKRVSELKAAGIIEPTGFQGTSSRGARVEEYRLTDHGKGEYARLVEESDG